jgi:RNA polymerase sigma factor (sigma-70 family)
VPSWSDTIEAVQEGDLRAVERVRGLVRRSTFGSEDWEDTCQDILVHLLTRPREWEEPRSWPAYLSTMTRHACTDRFRRERGRRRGEGSIAAKAWRRRIPLEEGHARAAAGPLQRMLEVGLLEAFAHLRARERRAVVSKYLLGQSNAEAALALSESVATYRRLVAGGLGALRRELEEPRPSTPARKRAPRRAPPGRRAAPLDEGDRRPRRGGREATRVRASLAAERSASPKRRARRSAAASAEPPMWTMRMSPKGVPVPLLAISATDGPRRGEIPVGICHDARIRRHLAELQAGLRRHRSAAPGAYDEP